MNTRSLLLPLAILACSAHSSEPAAPARVSPQEPAQADRLQRLAAISVALNKGDYATALPLVRAGAESGDPDEEETLGLMYDNGEGVPKDPNEALHWLAKAAEKGKVVSARVAGSILVTQRRASEALYYYKEAATEGDAESQAVIGLAWLNGDASLPKDYRMARVYLEPAAAKGNALAQYSLSKMYIEGDGLPRDPVKGNQLLQACATTGYAACEYEWGQTLATGYGGVPLDMVQARRWFSKAAVDGDLRGAGRVQAIDNGLAMGRR